jgi:LuxR family maltose regulon positive regulatory protein
VRSRAPGGGDAAPPVRRRPLGERTAALRAIKAALDLGALLDVARLVVFAGSAVRAVFGGGPTGRTVCAKLANRVLGARAQQQPETTLQLSECDQEVLVLLPSLLSLEGIAEDLSISVNTVKARLRAVYLKLGVTSRPAAVVAAHGRELLRSGLYVAR